MITSNPNYVKKIVFPLYTLGEMVVGSSLVNAAISTGILIAMKTITVGGISPDILLLPLVWLPFVLSTRNGMDISNDGCIRKRYRTSHECIGKRDNVLKSNILSIKFNTRWVKMAYRIEPLVKTIENTRVIIMENHSPNIMNVLVQVLLGLVWCELTYRLLKKSSRYFGDIL